MNKEALEGLEGRKVSIMLNKRKPDGVTCESYIGFISKVGNTFVELDYKRASYKKNHSLEKLIIDLSIVDSLWIFED